MKKIFILFAFLCSLSLLNAQKIKGDISCLKGQQQINIVYHYDEVTYDGESAAQYLQKEKLAKDPEWKEAWTSSYRTDKWQTRFEEDLNEYAGKKNIECGNFSDAAYTIHINFKDIDPGAFAGPMSVPAKITGVITFTKGEETTPFATLEFKKIAGNAYVVLPRPELRVAEAMSQVGEILGKTLSKIK